MSIHVLVVANGNLLGKVIVQYFAEVGENVIGVGGQNSAPNMLGLDLRGKAFDRFLSTNSFDLVINCAAVGGSYAMETQEAAVWINSLLPHRLERRYEISSTRVFHVSSAQVFSGSAGPYDEYRVPDNPHFVARSRALGELHNDKDLTVRLDTFESSTPGGGQGLLGWFLNAPNPLRAASCIRFSPISCLEAARALHMAYGSGMHGTWHLAPRHGTDTIGLMRRLASVFGSDRTIVGVREHPYDRSLCSIRTDAPCYPSGYRSQLEELKVWMEAHEQLYAAHLGPNV